MDKFYIQSHVKKLLENELCISILIDGVIIKGYQKELKINKVLDLFGSSDDYVMSIVIPVCHSPRIKTNKEILYSGKTYFIKFIEPNDYDITLHIGAIA